MLPYLLSCPIFALQTNTFQAVIATDGVNTYAINQYLDDGINWGQCGGNNAQAGVTGSTDSIGPPSSGTEDIVDIETGSNFGEPGKYVYCIHEKEKREPTSEHCAINLYLHCNNKIESIKNVLFGLKHNRKQFCWLMYQWLSHN